MVSGSISEPGGMPLYDVVVRFRAGEEVVDLSGTWPRGLMAGSTGRAVHWVPVFPGADPHAPRGVTYCRLLVRAGQVDLLHAVNGQVCEVCLIRRLRPNVTEDTPGPGFAVPVAERYQVDAARRRRLQLIKCEGAMSRERVSCPAVHTLTARNHAAVRALPGTPAHEPESDLWCELEAGHERDSDEGGDQLHWTLAQTVDGTYWWFAWGETEEVALVRRRLCRAMGVGDIDLDECGLPDRHRGRHSFQFEMSTGRL